MHVHYQSKLQAKKALSKNGKVFGGRMMIGVLPCIDKVCDPQVLKNKQTPRKDNSIVSKVKEYMFGW
nr:hypothetical protein BaRGS_016028 [Batillaria attramentaria]